MRPLLPVMALSFLSLVQAMCSASSSDNAGPDGDSDADADTDTDTDVDGDTDADTDAECEDGVVECLDDLTVQACNGGQWVISDTCDDGTQLCVDGECLDCESIEFTIQTMQACAISILDGFEMDGEGFISLGGNDYRVFAMDRWGEGHVVAWCDATTLPELLAAFNVTGYLGQVESPHVASFGDNYLCNPAMYAGLPADITYLGEDLPAIYQGDAAGLAADWDVIVLCGFRIGWDTDWSEELGSFVADLGKGFLAVMEYESLAFQEDFDAMNLITAPAGIAFEPLNLEWAPTSTSVTLECVPDVPPVVE
jgi:hypothetical protein